MGKSVRDIAKKGRGRPKSTGLGTGILVRMHVQLDALDAWIARQDNPKPTRPEAIRRLVEIGLTVKARPRQPSRVRAVRANEMAAKAIDGLIDPAASTEEAANRKRRLLKGPEEFREVRVDCVKKI
jgi:hypothetical protein